MGCLFRTSSGVEKPVEGQELCLPLPVFEQTTSAFWLSREADWGKIDITN